MLPRFVTIKKFAELSGYSQDAIRSKIYRGDWLQDAVWIKAPDGRVLIDIDGYNRWVEYGVETVGRRGINR